MGIEVSSEFLPEGSDKTYRSIEGKIWDFVSNSEFCEYVLKTGYAAFTFPLRIPTTIRKMRKGQTIYDRVPPIFEPDVVLAEILAAEVGILSHVGNLLWAVSNAENGKLEHLAVTAGVYGITNLASGIYEGINYFINREKEERK